MISSQKAKKVCAIFTTIKMMQVAGYKCRNFFSAFELLLLLAALPTRGQATVGISLKLQGATIPNNSLVAIGDLLYRRGNDTRFPTNINQELHDQALLCITDLEDCCRSPNTTRGNWYHPNGTAVEFYTGDTNAAFQRNRGPYEVRRGRQFYGSVRLWRRWSPTERGRFYCELPSAADPSVNQTLYVYILDIVAVSISPSGSSQPSPGNNFSLTCSAVIKDIPLPANVSSPTFEWFIGASGNAVLPSGASPTVTTIMNSSSSTNSTYTSTLQFSPFSQSHAGMYTCRLGVGRLVNSTNITVNVPDPQSVTITTDQGNIVVTGSDITLICIVQMKLSVMDSKVSLLMVEAQLIRPNGTMLNLSHPMISDMTFTFTTRVKSFSDADAGNYTCSATVSPGQSSPYLTGTGELSGKTEIEIGFLSTTERMPTEEMLLLPVTGKSSIPSVISGGIAIVIIVLLAMGVALAVILWFLRRRRYSVSEKKELGIGLMHPPALTAYSTQLLEVDNVEEPTITKFPSDTTVTEGEDMYFKIKVSGEPQPTVTWYHDGEPVREDYAHEIELGGNLAISSTELKHSGVYKAVVVNQYGSEERELKLIVYKEDDTESKDDATSHCVVSSQSIPIPEFAKYVAEHHANSNQAFKDLYKALDTGEGGHSIEYATTCERKSLNRFKNIVVYDDNRIVLKPLNINDCQTDYINACYVDGYSNPNKFIATQGPLPKTVVDLWRLIWQEHPPTIVMVTNVVEGSHIKCQKYWPETGRRDFGPFQVTLTGEQIFADYTIRTLSVSLGSEASHKVTQYHFTAWPDHGVPEYASSILAFHRRVKAQHQPSRGPMVVHCSAGVGRTGTFIVIDNILEQIEEERVVDIPRAITKIRQRRMKMVQTQDQFTFIHDVILESVTCGNTQISATNLKANITKMTKKDNHSQSQGFKHQFETLEQVSPNLEEVHCGGALSCPERSRNDKHLPTDRWRVTLKGEQPDYIHAININGYKHKKAFIVAEGPMQSTVRNFWKMIFERNCAVVVMTSGLVEGGQEASIQYWPDSGTARYGEFSIDLLGEEKLEGFFIRCLSITNTKTQKAHKVTQFHITCWRPDGHCSNLKSVTDVIDEMTKVQIRSGNKPIVVHCSDTVTRSGMFCAIATTIERCKTEGVVDVFQVVKMLRVQKPGAVPTVENYKLIFNTVLVYLESFETYANFQNI